MPNYGTRFTADTFKLLDANKAHTVYRSNRALARSMNTPWFNANPSNFTLTTGGPRAVTAVGWKIRNQPVGVATYGEIRATYYVTFRGMRISP